MTLTSRLRDPAQLASWQQWRDETVAWSRRTGKVALVVNKLRNTITIYERGQAVASYVVDLGRRPGRKTAAGDEATPEGRYHVAARKDRGESRFHRALQLDYPNADDLARLERLKRAGQVPASAAAGRNIEIHGEGGRRRDWTLGCIALTNGDMDAVFARAEVGTPVTIIGGDAHALVVGLGTGGRP